jgi:uncharacterized protein YqfA (UPF0365 family)
MRATPDPALAGARVSYEAGALDEADLAPTWSEQLQRWLQDAQAAGVVEPNAVVLGTADADGTPSARTVLAKGLDAGTAFEILSIDIADVDVGSNIGARLQADQAEADMRVARAKAEERRAFAVALEQEQIAAVQENRAKVIAAEAQVPLAIAEAFRQGNLGIMDYYKMRNLQADTSMRETIAGPGEQKKD